MGTRLTGRYGRPREGGTLLFCPPYVPLSRRLDLSSGPDSGQGSFSASGLKTGLDRGLCG